LEKILFESTCSTVGSRPTLIHTVVIWVVRLESARGQTTRCHNPEDYIIIFTPVETSDYIISCKIQGSRSGAVDFSILGCDVISLDTCFLTFQRVVVVSFSFLDNLTVQDKLAILQNIKNHLT
jgi:hypothetical protein